MKLEGSAGQLSRSLIAKSCGALGARRLCPLTALRVWALKTIKLTMNYITVSLICQYLKYIFIISKHMFLMFWFSKNR